MKQPLGWGRLLILIALVGLLWVGSRIHDLRPNDTSQLPVHAEDALIQVRLSDWSGGTRIAIGLEGHWVMRGSQGALLRDGIDFQGELQLAPDGAHLGSWHVRAPSFTLTTDGDAGLRLGSRHYRGTLLVTLENSDSGLPTALQCDLLLPLEDYVLGVLCGEMATSTPNAGEALQAQAIAARTYALWKLSQRGGTLVDTTSDQRFESVDFETSAAREAVLATKGLVLAWEEELLPAWYHAASPAKASGFSKQNMPPLRGASDHGCTEPTSWRRVIPATRLDEFAHEQSLGTWVRRIAFQNRDAGGRILSARIDGDGEAKQFAGEFLRATFGLPSSLWESMRVQPDGSLVIRGRGRGHGVGLCQEGAMRRAISGATVQQLLGHYYPGAATIPYHALSLSNS